MSKKRLTLSESVMSRIDREHIAMKPKWYFVLGSFALVTGIIGSVAVSVFFISLISFSLKTHGPMGEIRYQQLLSSFPWWAIVAAIGGLVAGIWFLKKYDFSYKRNFFGIVLAFIVAIIITGWLLNYFEVDRLWSQHASMRRFYQQYDGGWRGGGTGKRKNLNDQSTGGKQGGGRFNILNQ